MYPITRHIRSCPECKAGQAEAKKAPHGQKWLARWCGLCPEGKRILYGIRPDGELDPEIWKPVGGER